MQERYLIAGVIIIIVIGIFVIISNSYERSGESNNEFDNDSVIVRNQEISLICEMDSECTIINKEAGYRSCWSDRCARVDYSLDRYIAVNIESFEKYRESEIKFRPSNEECGLAPGCPITLININFDAKCVNGRCKKIPR